MPAAPVGPPPISRTITLAEGMTVKDLADKLDLRVKDVLAKLLMKRMMLNINSTLDTETAMMIAREFGADVKMRTFEQELLQVESEDTKPEDLVARAPVVTVMGHVDHGKTTLLDAIRSTRVAEREAGGITQHIGAYHVPVGDGRNIVFLDTPGHEAFTMMRARGAKVTDVVVLVVAADDGVMPQTQGGGRSRACRERADHRRRQQDRQGGTNPDNVKRELAELGLVPEAWGGTTVMVDVSAKKKQNLDLLLEMILLVTDIGELKANPKRNASGTVLESKIDRGRGPVATILVQDGTLHVGDTFIAGTIVGKVRALIDDRGRSIKVAAAVDAGGSARPWRRAVARRRVPGAGRPGQGASDCGVPAGAGEGQGAWREERPRHARVAAAAARRGQQGPARSSSRPTCRALPRCWPTRSRSSAPRR